MWGLTITVLSNLISTLLVIILNGDFSKNKYLVMQSLASTFFMILNTNSAKFYKFALFKKNGPDKQDTWIKNRVDRLMKHGEKSIGTTSLIILSVGIILQSALLLT